MAYSKLALLDKAIEITKEYARSGYSRPVELVLENVYEKLKQLNQGIEQ